MKNYKKIVQIIPNNNLNLMAVYECKNVDEGGKKEEMKLPV